MWWSHRHNFFFAKNLTTVTSKPNGSSSDFLSSSDTYNPIPSWFLKISSLSLVFCVLVVYETISPFFPFRFNHAIGATTSFSQAWFAYFTLVHVVTGIVIASGVILLFDFKIEFLFWFSFKVIDENWDDYALSDGEFWCFREIDIDVWSWSMH